MDHFDDQQWIDFVRGVTEPGRGAELEAHLARGCSSCVTAESGWRNIMQLAGRTAQFVAPEDAVRSIKAAFLVAQAPQLQMGTIQLAKLVFDSFFSPSPHGARSSWFGQRHCVYESGGFTIEFHLGAGRENDKSFLTGQIANPLCRSGDLMGSQVKVIEGPSVTAETTANAHGEFMVELRMHDRQWILIEIPERQPIAIPIPGEAA